MEAKEADTLPFFLQKLWQIVCDPSTDGLISWSEDGKSFFVMQPEQFSHEVLPQYFKHRNFSSFVRQLNMYGFHKMVSTENGLAASGEEIGFSHPSFVRDKPDQLDQIKRKVNPRNVQLVQQASHMSREELDTILKSLHELKGRQDQVVSALSGLTQDKDGLWSEVLTLRQQVSRQDAVIKKLLGFIGQCVTFGSLPMKRPHLAVTQTGELDGSQYKVGAMSSQGSLQQDHQFAASGAGPPSQASSLTQSSPSDDIFVKPSKVTIEDDNDPDDLDYLFSSDPSVSMGLLPDMTASGLVASSLAQASVAPHAAASSMASTASAYSSPMPVATAGSPNMAAAATNAAATGGNYRITPPKPKDDLNPKCIHSCGEHIDNVQVGIEGMQKYLSSTLGSATVDQAIVSPTIYRPHPNLPLDLSQPDLERILSPTMRPCGSPASDCSSIGEARRQPHRLQRLPPTMSGSLDSPSSDGVPVQPCKLDDAVQVGTPQFDLMVQNTVHAHSLSPGLSPYSNR